MHSVKIYHSDLKPDNVILFPYNIKSDEITSNSPKVADFGEAKFFSLSNGNKEVGIQEQIFISPEKQRRQWALETIHGREGRIGALQFLKNILSGLTTPSVDDTWDSGYSPKLNDEFIQETNLSDCRLLGLALIAAERKNEGQEMISAAQLLNKKDCSKGKFKFLYDQLVKRKENFFENKNELERLIKELGETPKEMTADQFAKNDSYSLGVTAGIILKIGIPTRSKLAAEREYNRRLKNDTLRDLDLILKKSGTIEENEESELHKLVSGLCQNDPVQRKSVESALEQLEALYQSL